MQQRFFYILLLVLFTFQFSQGQSIKLAENISEFHSFLDKPSTIILDSSTQTDALVEIATGNVLAEFKGEVEEISLSPDRSYFFVSYEDGSGEVWTVDGESILELEDSWLADFSPDSNHFVVYFGDGRAEMWTRAGMRITDFNNYAVDLAAFSLDSAFVVVDYGGSERDAAIWTVQGRLIRALPSGASVRARFSSDSSLMTVSSRRDFDFFSLLNDETPSLPDDAKGIDFHPLEPFMLVRREGLTELQTLDGDVLAVLNGSSRFIEGENFILVERETIKELWTLEGKQIAAFQSDVPSQQTTFSSDKSLVAFTSMMDLSKEIWTMQGQRVTDILDDVVAVTFHPTRPIAIIHFS